MRPLRRSMLFPARGGGPVSSSLLTLILALVATVCLGACNDEDPLTPDASAPPQAVLNVVASTSRDSVHVTWTPGAGASSYRVELVGETGTLAQDVSTGTEAVFSGLPDGVTYQVQVWAVNSRGEVPGSTASVAVNHFPWDEYFPESLHATRAGKAQWYGKQNGGFEAQMKVSPATLYPGCQGCHRADQPVGLIGCENCHDTPTPQLGAKVDATLSGVCGQCHNRSVYEAVDHRYSDVHRDVHGFTCMSCHSMGDVHGDGVAYSSMFEEGAIDASCEGCHETLENHLFHSAHEGTVDCTLCHTQTVISCYNCHMEGALRTPPEKLARRRVMDWKFMVNYNGKVTPANVVTLEYGDETFAAFAPYFSHTVARNAVKSCGDCHNSANMADLDADGELIVGAYDPGTTNIKTLKGIIPVPYNYEDALKFDFVTYDRPTKTWSLLRSRGPDRFQMLYATPLSKVQMDKLR